MRKDPPGFQKKDPLHDRLASSLSAAALAAAILSGVVMAAPPAPVVVDAVQFSLAPKHEKLMVGGRFEGSNVLPTEGFQLLAETSAEARVQEGTTVRFQNTTPYRWVRFAAPREFHGNDLQLVFQSGGASSAAADSRTALTVALSALIWASRLRRSGLLFDPGPSNVRSAGTKVTLRSHTPGATIRYTLDGTTPGPRRNALRRADQH